VPVGSARHDRLGVDGFDRLDILKRMSYRGVGLAVCQLTHRPRRSAIAEDLRTCGVSRRSIARLRRDTIFTACERKELRHARVGGRRSIRLKPE
jgi:hypothetical protein